MKMERWLKKLERLSACNDGISFARTYKTSGNAWKYCKRGDWMLWLIGKMSGESCSDKRKKLVLTACKCARLALKHVPEGEKRPLQTIETSEKWAKDEGVTLAEVHDAADAAYAAADADAAAYAAAYAAAAAAYAAAADADAAAYAAAAADAADAADAAYAAADAAYAAADAARKETLAKCADIVREFYPNIDELL